MSNIVLVITVSSICFLHFAHAEIKERKAYCTGGRLYFGNVNESFPELFHANGIYQQEPYSYEGYNVYRHQSGELHMFHESGKAGSSGRWMIGPEVGDRKRAVFSVSSNMFSPALHAWRYWRIRGTDRQWSILHGVKCVCAEDNYERCTSGSLVLSGLEKEHPQAYAMGEYTLTRQTLNYRPVYKQIRATNPRFLYHTHGFWFVGSSPGHLGGSMMVPDAAIRPEQIINVWEAFQILKGKFTAVPKKHLRFTCLGLTGAGNLCEDDPCENGATCRTSSKGTICLCNDGFFGTKCKHNKSCGSYPLVEGANFLISSGSGLMDLAFYKCEASVSAVPVIAVCEANRQWHVKGSC